MKVLTTVFACAIVGSAVAQTVSPAPLTQRAWQTRTHTVSGQFGLGWFGLFNDVEIEYEGNDPNLTVYNVDLDGGPTATLAYDYRFGRSFSLGGAVAYQSNHLTNFRRDGNFGEPQERIDGDARVGRTFVSARTLWHYGRTRNFEFYSGLRVGATFYRTTASGEIEPGDVGFNNTEPGGGDFVLPHLTIIPFGFKGYVGDKVFVGAESMFGSPHVLAAQVGYRF